MKENKSIWSAAAAPALIMGGISVAYLILTHFTGLMKGGGAAVIGGLLTFILWGAKLAACILVMRHLLRSFAASEEDMDSSRVFKFGMAVSFLSALLYSAAYLGYVLYIVPDQISRLFDTILGQYGSMLDSNSISTLEAMQPKMPSIYFFTNLIYCFLFGTVLSAIFSHK